VAGLIVGGSSAFVGWQAEILNSSELLSAASMGTLGAVLPDLDADQGKPLRFLFETLSVLLPSLAIGSVHPYLPEGASFLVSFVVLSYLAVRYGVFSLVQRLTVHRGSLHSIPFALIAGLTSWLAFSAGNPGSASLSNPSFYIGLSLFLGSLSHLVLDELSSFSLRWGFVPYIKSSSGSALKLGGSSTATTLGLYGLLAILLAILAILNR